MWDHRVAAFHHKEGRYSLDYAQDKKARLALFYSCDACERPKVAKAEGMMQSVNDFSTP